MGSEPEQGELEGARLADLAALAPVPQVTVLVVAPEVMAATPTRVLTHLARARPAQSKDPPASPEWALIGGALKPEDGNDLEAAARRVLRISINSFNVDNLTLVRLGAHEQDGRKVTSFAVTLPYQSRLVRSATELATAQQWIDLSTLADMVTRGDWSHALGLPLESYLASLRSPPAPTARAPSLASASAQVLSRPGCLGSAKLANLRVTRELVKAFVASLEPYAPEELGDPSDVSLMEGLRRTKETTAANFLEPDTAALFFVPVRFTTKKGELVTLRALVDEGSMLTLMSPKVAQLLGCDQLNLKSPQGASGVIPGTTTVINQYCSASFAVGDLAVASELTFANHPFFVVKSSIQLILGKPWLALLQSLALQGRVIPNWQVDLRALATHDGRVVVASSVTEGSLRPLGYADAVSKAAFEALSLACGGRVRPGPTSLARVPEGAMVIDPSDAVFNVQLLEAAAPKVIFAPPNGLDECTALIIAAVKPEMKVQVVTPDWHFHSAITALRRKGFVPSVWLPAGTVGAYASPSGSISNSWGLVCWDWSNALGVNVMLAALHLSPGQVASAHVAEAPPLDEAGVKRLLQPGSDPPASCLTGRQATESAERYLQASRDSLDVQPSQLSKGRCALAMAHLAALETHPAVKPWILCDWEELAREVRADPAEAVLCLLRHAGSDSPSLSAFLEDATPDELADVARAAVYSIAHPDPLAALKPSIRAQLTAEEQKTLARAFDPVQYEEMFDEVLLNPNLASDRSADAHLAREERLRLDALLDRHSTLFKDVTDWEDSEGRPAEFEMAIKLKDETAIPPRRRYGRLSSSDFEELRKQVEVLLKANFIAPSTSPFGAPVLFVPKKDGTRRFAVDFRALNDMTVPDVTPLPAVDDMLQHLQGSKVFSKIDATAFFWQFRIKEADRHKAAMVTPLGHFDWRVVPFGLTNAPAHAMRSISTVLQAYLYKFCMVLLDDIIVYSNSVEEHLEHLRLIFEALELAKIFIKRKKCEFCKSRLHYLGHVVSADGIEAEGNKLQAIKSFPPPKNVRDVRAFLGLAGYYRKLIRNFSKLAASLSDLTKANAEGPVALSGEQLHSFEEIKQALLSAPVLKFVDPKLPFVLQVDASAYAVGGVLMQPGESGTLHPVGYFSRKLSAAQQRYTVTARELLAITEALRFWRTELHGCCKLTVHTDHRPLSYLRSVQPLGDMHARWLQTIESVPFDLVHKPGFSMGPADTLSRRSDYADSETGGAAVKGRAVPLPDSPDDILSLMQPGDVCHSTELPTLSAEAVASIVAALLPPDELDACLEQPFFSLPVTTRRRRKEEADIALSDKAALASDAKVALSAEATPASDAEDSKTVTGEGLLSQRDFASLDGEMQATLASHDELLAELRRATLADVIWYSKAASSQDRDKLFLDHGLVYAVMQGSVRVYVPADVRGRVFRMHHEPVYCGHLGSAKTLERVQRSFFWPGIKSDVENFCRQCPACQSSKNRSQKPFGLPNPFSAPFRRFEVLTMDEVSGLPTSARGHTKAWIFVDKLSKFLTVVPFKERCEAIDIAQALLERVVQLWGLPRKIVSDRDPRLVSEVWQTLLRLWNVKPNTSTARHPQTDGQSENSVGTVVQMLRAFVNFNGSDWDLLLPGLTFAYNDSVHPVTGFSPLFLCHGEHPASPLSFLARDLAPDIARNPRQALAGTFVRRVNENIQRARILLNKARLRYQLEMEKKVRAHAFKPGDLVLLHHSGAGVVGDKMGKLGPRYVGPFRITEVVARGSAVRLDLPPLMKIEKTVNIGFVKPFHEASSSDSAAAVLQSNVVGFSNFRVVLDADGFHRAKLCVVTDPPGLMEGAWVTVGQCVEAKAFGVLTEYLASLPGLAAKSNYNLGIRVVDWAFRVPCQGIVASFDPLDAERQYEVWYHDGDSRWISQSHLQQIRIDVPAAPRKKPFARVLTVKIARTPMRVLVLFSGTDSVGRFFRKHLPEGSVVVSIDIDLQAPNAMHVNILSWDFVRYPIGFFDFIWASPPCTEYSYAKTTGTRDFASADALVARTLEIFAHFNPPFWVMENPQGYLRTRPFMQPMFPFRQTTSYCLFGDAFRKNTDLWSSHPLFPKLTPCSPAHPCIMQRENRRHLQVAQHGPSALSPGAVGGIKILHKIPERLLETICRPFFDWATSTRLNSHRAISAARAVYLRTFHQPL